MSDNNAGYEQFVVAPVASGTWWIWPVRDGRLNPALAPVDDIR
jgi:hypothetical protein